MRSRPVRPARFEPAQPTPLDPRAVRQHPGGPLPPHTAAVGPGSKWARDPARCRRPAAAVVDYAVWLAGRADLLAAARAELAGYDLACRCPLATPCHRDVLLDMVNPPTDPFAGGRAVGLTVRRPWASLLLVPQALGGTGIHASSWSTDYRGPVCICAGSLVADFGVATARAAALDADWHTRQRGWLGAAVLVDVHRARAGCCRARWSPRSRDSALNHWVFRSPGRLALPTAGRGFIGLRPVSWSVLVSRGAQNGPAA